MARRALLLLSLAAFARADALDDAVNLWAKKIASHLAPDEVAQVTWRDAIESDSASAAYLTRGKTLLARALQRRVRTPKPVEVSATLSRNLKGYLLVATIHRDEESAVEIVPLPRPASAPAAAQELNLERRLLWSQEIPLLDAAIIEDQMIVLDVAGLARYEQREGKWEKAESTAIAVPPSRDPRGRLTVTDNSVTAEIPGMICRGTWRRALAVQCAGGGRFTAGRNTMEEESWPPHFAQAEIGGDHVVLAADGRTYVYDGARKQLNVSDAWTDFAFAATCAGPKINASNPATDALAVFDLANHVPFRASGLLEMPGPVTALWPIGDFVTAIARNRSSNRYEVHRISVACGH